MYHRIIWETITIFALISLLLLWHSHYTVSAARPTHVYGKCICLSSVSDTAPTGSTKLLLLVLLHLQRLRIGIFISTQAAVLTDWCCHTRKIRKAKFLGEVGSILQEAALATFLITTIHKSLKPHSLSIGAAKASVPCQHTSTDTPACWG